MHRGTTATPGRSHRAARGARPAGGRRRRACLAGRGAHQLTADATPLDLASVALGQRDRDLVLTVRTRRRLDPAQLGTGAGHICLTVTQGRDHVVCVDRRAGAWRLRHAARARRRARREPERRDTRRAGAPGRPRARARARALVTWRRRRSRAATRSTRPPGAEHRRRHARNRWRRPPQRARAHGPRRRPAPRARRGPPARRTPGRVWRVVVRGCTPRGPAQVGGARAASRSR